MEKHIHLDFKVNIPEPKTAAEREKLSICIDKELHNWYHKNNEKKTLTEYMRNVMEMALAEARKRKEAS